MDIKCKQRVQAALRWFFWENEIENETAKEWKKVKHHSLKGIFIKSKCFALYVWRRIAMDYKL